MVEIVVKRLALNRISGNINFKHYYYYISELKWVPRRCLKTEALLLVMHTSWEPTVFSKMLFASFSALLPPYTPVHT